MESSKNFLIEVENLDVHFGKAHIIKNVSFRVQKNDIVGLFGISGAGKSTIVRVITCQLPRKNWNGNVSIAGLDPNIRSHRSKIVNKIGYIPQLELLNLYYDLSALKNVEIFASGYGINKKTARKRAEELFNILGIPEDTWDQPIESMSGGEKKRVSMAIGMINNPEIVFADEPSTGVDASRRYQIFNFLKELNREYGTTMFIITHDLEAALIVDKSAILREGQLLEFASPSELISSLPSKGKLARFKIEKLTEEKIERIKSFEYCERALRVGNNVVEVLLQDLEKNLPNLVHFMFVNNLRIMSMSRDVANFRRFFQLRIQEEEEKESNQTENGEINED